MTENKEVLTAEQIEQLATEIHAWLVKEGLWMDVAIYFNGKRWNTHNKDYTEFCYNENRYFEDVADPKDYFDFVRVPNILSMSFEGSLYEVLNGYSRECVKLTKKFTRIFEKYGLRWQFGNAWNLTCYEI